jgi:hypothetical protein
LFTVRCPRRHVPNSSSAFKSLKGTTHPKERKQGLLQRSAFFFTNCFVLTVWLGTRQAFLPGGHRTGAPGKHVIRGRAKYRLLDDKVRVYVAPPIEEIEASLVSYSFYSCLRI